jgi:hypothetical protein
MSDDFKNLLIQLKKDCDQMKASIKSLQADKDYNEIAISVTKPNDLDDNLDTLEDSIEVILEDLKYLMK